MARKSKGNKASNWVILLTDDDENYAQTTRMLLEHEGHLVLVAENGTLALNILREQHVDLLLLDYFMPGMTGENVVTELRKFNEHVQVILQTGYASEQPPRELLKRLDIQGYHDKSEGPDKLLLWVDVGLKAAYTMQLLQKSRQGLRYILDITPELHKIQPLEDLLQGIILQIAGLLGASNTFLAVMPQKNLPTDNVSQATDGFLAMTHDEMDLVIHASTGRFTGCKAISECLQGETLELVGRTLKQHEIIVTETSTIVPLCVGPQVIGVAYLDRPISSERDIELLHVFANQAAVAIHNTQLFEMATLDPLTGIYVRRFFDQWILREMRAAFRAQEPLSLLMIDMDGLKRINDTAGHLSGDRALAAMGKVLRLSLRDSDIPGRYGGDEFAILLRKTDGEGAQHVCQRILTSLQQTIVKGQEGDFPIRGSIGLTVLQPHAFNTASVIQSVPQDYFEHMVKIMIHDADRALYQAKRTGGNRLCVSDDCAWSPLP